MAIRLEPDYARAYLNRASVYTETSRYEKALVDYTAALKLRPDSPTYLNAHCWGLLGVHRAREALPECSRSLSLRPDSADTLDSRGYAYLQLGDLPAAIADFTHALKLDPNPSSTVRFAKRLIARGDFRRDDGVALHFGGLSRGRSGERWAAGRRQQHAARDWRRGAAASGRRSACRPG
jgi:tetratricopeptide (TPR) repeat protein